MSYKKKKSFYWCKYPRASEPLRRKPDDLKIDQSFSSHQHTCTNLHNVLTRNLSVCVYVCASRWILMWKWTIQEKHVSTRNITSFASLHYYLMLSFFEKRRKKNFVVCNSNLPPCNFFLSYHTYTTCILDLYFYHRLKHSKGHSTHSYGCAFSCPALYVHSIAMYLWNNLSRFSHLCFGRVSDCGHLLFVHNWFPKEMNCFFFRNLYICFIPVYFEFFYTFLLCFLDYPM